MKIKGVFLAAILVANLFISGNLLAYSGGTGEPNNPYQIATKQNLLDLAGTTADYGKCFILTADVNMEGQVFTTAIIAADPVAGGSGFDGNAFSGTFDGNGYKVAHFTISNYSNGYLGLFGCIDSHGLVKNLCVENFAVSGIYFVGSLVGYNNRGSISNCCSAGSVNGGIDALYVCGLVGYNYRGNIANCYSTSSVNGGSDAHYVGGIVGYNYGSIANCYSTGSINGGSNARYVGGLVGYNDYGSINNSFSTGAVSGDLNTGGIVGYNRGSVNNSFWDMETSGQTISDGGMGKTTAEMKTLSTFTSAGWDFVDAWGIGNGQTYPYLKPFNGINPVDINYSGRVDFADFAIFAENWLQGM